MSITLSRPPQGSTNWFGAVDGNWQTIQNALISSQLVNLADVTVANTTAATTLISGTKSGSTSIPGGSLAAGRVIRVKAKGIYSTTGTPNITLQCKYAGTIIATTGTFAAFGGESNQTIDIEIFLTCRTYGASGTLKGDGHLGMGDSGTPRIWFVSMCTSVATVDMTQAQTIDLIWTWGTASPSNSVFIDTLFIDY